MSYILKLSLLLVTLEGFKAKTNVEQRFEDGKIVPDVLSAAPKNICHVLYPSEAVPHLGNKLSTNLTWDEPTVNWSYDLKDYYTLVMIDPDGPTPQKPIWREIQHLVVGNIRGNNVTSGDVVTSYLRPRPPAGSDAHRYIFLVFKQPRELLFDENIILERSPERFNFSIKKFAKKYNLNDIVCGNYFYAKHEEE